MSEYPRVRWDRLYAKHCPHRTDPTSRFAKVISENLASRQKGSAGELLKREGWEADRWAGAIAHTVKMLWEARAEIVRLGGDPFPHMKRLRKK